jgi:hypothetical protein
MRLETVTKKNPKRMMRTAETTLMPKEGAMAMATTSASVPPRTTRIDRSRSVRGTWVAALSPEKFTFPRPRLKAEMMVGTVRINVSTPPAATAPAPM